MNFTNIQRVNIPRYRNLIRYEEVLKSVIVGYSNSPFLLSSWHNPAANIIGRCTEIEVSEILSALENEFGVDLSGLSYNQGLLFIKHFLLICREFNIDELISYKKELA